MGHKIRGVLAAAGRLSALLDNSWARKLIERRLSGYLISRHEPEERIGARVTQFQISKS